MSSRFSPTTLKRWVRAAQGIDGDVLKKLEEEEYWNVKGIAIWDNDFLMGFGAKAKVKLCSAFAIQALNYYLAQGSLSADAFVNRICTPLKTLEIWGNLMVKRYGSLCKDSFAYGRLM